MVETDLLHYQYLERDRLGNHYLHIQATGDNPNSATLAGINPELYEAADIDGATRMQKMRFVTLPALSNTIITVLILNLAKVMNMFESVFVLYNNAVYSVSDVISTYIYRQTFAIALPNYGYSTAVGLFKSLVGCVLVLICNWASKKTRGRGIV